MKCLCNVRCRLVKDIDMFGKEPELYYKTRPKKTSWIGRILSVAFVLIYFAFFLYKLIRMLKRVDVTFYDTFTYAAKPPQVPITHDNFYVAFALEDPDSYDPFFDEGVYIPKAYFKRAEMKGDSFEWKEIPLEVERCKREKFGKSYQEVFEHIDLTNRYCFKDINNLILEGHFSYLLYSFFYIEFYPCRNTSESKTCQPIEVIDHYLKNTFISFEIENIELTPKNFKSPTRPRNVDVYTTVGKKLFQEIHVYFEVVDIETDMDWFGFDEFENIKKERFLKYDEMVIMSNLIESDIYKTGEKFCDTTFKLSENVRTQRRVYTKFVTILGDIGGFMEVLFTLFRIISAFAVDILYEVSMVNGLFKFDLEKRNVILKGNFVEENKKIQGLKNKETFEEIEKNNIEELDDQIDNDIPITYIRKKNNHKSNRFKHSKVSVSKIDMINSNSASSKTKTNYKDIIEGINKMPNNIKNIEYNNKRNDIEKDNDKKIINKVRLNRACIYLWFCFVRRGNNINNVLLNEGMDIISRRLDIFNLFEKMNKAEQRNEPLLIKEFSMSDDCKRGLKLVRLETNASKGSKSSKKSNYS